LNSRASPFLGRQLSCSASPWAFADRVQLLFMRHKNPSVLHVLQDSFSPLYCFSFAYINSFPFSSHERVPLRRWIKPGICDVPQASCQFFFPWCW
jgi:hypothetical protein